MNEARPDAAKPAPFDTARLDALLEDDGIDQRLSAQAPLQKAGRSRRHAGVF
jgi:hypothetical protein